MSRDCNRGVIIMGLKFKDSARVIGGVCERIVPIDWTFWWQYIFKFSLAPEVYPTNNILYIGVRIIVYFYVVGVISMPSLIWSEDVGFLFFVAIWGM